MRKGVERSAKKCTYVGHSKQASSAGDSNKEGTASAEDAARSRMRRSSREAERHTAAPIDSGAEDEQERAWTRGG
jgi:hypothetical protein